MSEKPYYLAYESRYQTLLAAGGTEWGHEVGDEGLAALLAEWVKHHQLRGKRIIEFACGMGAPGMLLSRLGCRYHGTDASPTAVEKTRELLRDLPGARVDVLDMVKDTTGECYDAALECSSLHMLVADVDRAAYLRNACNSLKSGAPMLFCDVGYGRNAYSGPVDSPEQWRALFDEDFTTPQQRFVKSGDKQVEVWLPTLPARGRNREDYIAEMTAAGFIVDALIENADPGQEPRSANIFVHKP